jgi:Lon-like ATP-dependent protease
VKADFEHNVAASSKEGIEIVYVDDVREVLKIAFAGQPVASLADRLPVASQTEVGSESTSQSSGSEEQPVNPI